MPANSPTRGDIYHLDFDEIGPHYGVVISGDAINRNASTVLIAVISSKGTDTIYPHEFLLPAGLLRKPSKVKCQNITAWPKEELNSKNFSCSLDPKDMQGLDVALMKALDVWY
ncbi:type II toxin-antitoxin system PemK/MazF family toxin [Candidatus Acetothermia bacterium]|nr:type II toxin-antitoxin system PemK/MazF family toxin [Candidatus Acetothermia bacterium]